MGLRLNTTLLSGVVANYWHITGLQWERDKERATVVLSLYLSQEVATAGAASLSEANRLFNVPLTRVELASGNVLSLCYGRIKASNLDADGNEQNPFVAAEDC